MPDHGHRFSPEKMRLLDTPERRKLMPPAELLAMVSVQTSDIVVDLGAGTGYFSVPSAQMTEGTVYAVDVEPKMLEAVKERAQEQGLSNLKFITGLIEDIPLSDNTADVAIASLVLHGVRPLAKGLQEIYRILKVGGRFLCLEFEPKASPMGPPLTMRIASADMEKALGEAGFTVTKRWFPAEFLYALVATKSVLDEETEQGKEYRS